MNRRLACAALLMLASSVASAAPAVTQLSDWQAVSGAAARSQRPVVLFFTLPGCRFCEDVRQRYMQSLVREGKLVREVVLGSAAPVTGLDGAPTQEAVVRKFGVRAAPTVLMVDAQGRALAEPIVGGDVAGMYGGYLDNAFERAARELAR
jgi:thioredoxin-related protein